MTPQTLLVSPLPVRALRINLIPFLVPSRTVFVRHPGLLPSIMFLVAPLIPPLLILLATAGMIYFVFLEALAAPLPPAVGISPAVGIEPLAPPPSPLVLRPTSLVLVPNSVVLVPAPLVLVPIPLVLVPIPVVLVRVPVVLSVPPVLLNLPRVPLNRRLGASIPRVRTARVETSMSTETNTPPTTRRPNAQRSASSA